MPCETQASAVGKIVGQLKISKKKIRISAHLIGSRLHNKVPVLAQMKIFYLNLLLGPGLAPENW